VESKEIVDFGLEGERRSNSFNERIDDAVPVAKIVLSSSSAETDALFC
jgi:hypothetical protein